MINKESLKVAVNVPINQLFDYLSNGEAMFTIGQYVTDSFWKKKNDWSDMWNYR